MTKEPKIQSGIPIPERYNQGHFARVLKRMGPGDSVKLETERDRDSASMAALRLGIAYTTRKVDDGYRLWRTT